ncbi:MAG: dihydropteroate synthase [Candidatus Thermoplasmatota archaeon]|nr:dihydropteroate synthase [Candidatus Thermoplasmatota archaeon]MCL5794629.1 dihydropteroate synthase [Candidatus Thermoplasmatota archaeon]
MTEVDTLVFPSPQPKIMNTTGESEFLVYSRRPQSFGMQEPEILEVRGSLWKRYRVVMNEKELGTYLSELDSCGSLGKSFSSSIFGKLHSQPKLPQIMGIVNVTPDSFYPGSRIEGSSFSAIDAILDQKPDIIDIGGESTRPGSGRITPDEEIGRIRPVIQYISETSSIPVSVDTRNPETANYALRYRIAYLNDVSGFRNPQMIGIAADHSLKSVVMHMKGEPATMQSDTHYDDIYFEINHFLASRAHSLMEAGVKPLDIIVDPGIGFGKTSYQNIEIISNFHAFSLGFETLVGASRKSFIGTLTGRSVESRLSGTLASSMYLMLKNTGILRLHDVQENRDAMKVYLGLLGGGQFTL